MRKVFFFITVFLIIVITILRENIFVALNAIIEGRTYNQASFHFFDNFFKQFHDNFLMNLKWILTGLFSCVVSFLSVLAVNLWFKARAFNLIFIKMYLFAFFLVSIIGIVAVITDVYQKYYFVLRKTLGVIQSPIPFFLMFVLFYFLTKKDK